ncbi:hypothetical protein IAU60_000014 [Kwoniella sp. DSM 27419]
MAIASNTDKLKVAVIGAGPGGLAAIINLGRLAHIELSVFDQASELREVGAGISINENTWRHLKLLGAAEQVEQNGITGELLARKYHKVDPEAPPRSRIERYKLQNALLSQVPKGLIQLSKRLAEISEDTKGATLTFQDGTVEGPFDLVIGADGIRSVGGAASDRSDLTQAVRRHAFPDHKLSYTGKVAYRTLIPQSKVAHIPGIPQASTFWHARTIHVYTDPLDNGLFEIATRAMEDDEEGKKVSWGQKVPREKVIHHYERYCDTIRQVIAAPDEWLEFAMFGGPRLESVVHSGHIALLGDASHPLSGAFGAGAAFAFEDAYVLAKALEYVHVKRRSLSQALRLYDDVRSPHYKGLYAILNGFGHNAKEVEAISPPLADADYINEINRRNWSSSNDWIYKYDVTKVWQKYILEQEVEGALARVTLEETEVKDGAQIPEIAVAA